MANIKFEIDGKTYDFTSENFWKNFVIDNEGNIILKPKQEKRSPFERVAEGEEFYYISGDERLMTNKEYSWYCADGYYDCANYCTDAGLLQRRALYEKLERCLWRFSMENGGSGNYYPVLNRITRRWSITCTEIQRFGPSFKTREACARAIEEVVKPMLNGVEDEIFEWRGRL